MAFTTQQVLDAEARVADEERREALIDEIAKRHAQQYWDEQDEGEYPNLGLRIREALMEYEANRT